MSRVVAAGGTGGGNARTGDTKMTSKRLNGFVAGMVDVIIKANGYNPETGVNGGDRELAQGELGKVLFRTRKDILLATGLTAEQIDEATAAVADDHEREAAEEASAKAEKKLYKASLVAEAA